MMSWQVQKDKKEHFHTLMQGFYAELDKHIQSAPENWFLWSLFRDLLESRAFAPNNSTKANSSIPLKIDRNKLFFFQIGNDCYIHLVDSWTNLRITPAHAEILNQLAFGEINLEQIIGRLSNNLKPETVVRFVNYLQNHGALESV